MQNYKAQLKPESFYHIYNRANGREKLFLNDNNYTYFLKKYHFYITPIADTFAYCLMPNHFHFLVRVKQLLQTSDVSKTSDVCNLNPSEAFRRLLMSYTKAYNKQTNRKGSLFIPRFNRKKITSDEYLKTTLNYIHQNPVLHGYVNELDDWKYSSYSAFFSSAKTNICKKEAINWFDDLENFKACHDIKKAENLALEMDLSY